MRITSDTIDIKMSDDLDIIIDILDNDIAKATEYTGEVTTQMIVKRIFSRKHEWKFQPDCGANLFDHRGSQLTGDLITKIKSTVTNELIRELAFSTTDFQVKVIPLTSKEVAIVVLVQTRYMKDPVVVTGGLSLDSYAPTHTNLVKGV